MGNTVRNIPVEEAIQFLENRTLAALPGDVARIVYLASTRDYNTGDYLHAGLFSRFSEEAAMAALIACHQEIFKRLVHSSLEDLVQQLEAYMQSLPAPPAKFLEGWMEYEAYRALIPRHAESLLAKLFFCEITTALEILHARQDEGPRD